MDLFSLPLDASEGLQQLAKECAVPQVLMDHLNKKGFTSIALLGFSMQDDSEIPEFIESLQLEQAEIDAPKFSPARASLQRLLLKAFQRAQGQPHPLQTGPADASLAPPLLSKLKISAAEYGKMKESFQKAYPGELLCEVTTPSLPFITMLKEMQESKSFQWVPWRLRSSEASYTSFRESRPPRNDRQLLQSILKDDQESFDAPTCFVPNSGPVESPLLKFQHLLEVGLAMVEAAHLLTVKRFHNRFQHHALMIPRDQSFRPPSLPEVLDADKLVWTAIFQVQMENSWSLDDSINEVTFCRQEIQGALQPRLKPPLPSPKTPKRPADSDPPVAETVNKRDKRTPKKTTKPDPDADKPASKYHSSWFKNHKGKGICIRFNTGTCKSADRCRYLHICPVPDAKGEICGQPHSAKQHTSTPH